MAKNDQDAPLYTTVDDELYAEIGELTGEQILYVAIWEDSLADALSELETPDAEQISFDIDLYLEDGLYFELYDVTMFENLEAEPLVGGDVVSKALLTLVNQGVRLEEVAVDEDDQLVLVLGENGHAKLYLSVGGWLLDEWDELPA